MIYLNVLIIVTVRTTENAVQLKINENCTIKKELKLFISRPGRKNSQSHRTVKVRFFPPKLPISSRLRTG